MISQKANVVNLFYQSRRDGIQKHKKRKKKTKENSERSEPGRNCFNLFESLRQAQVGNSEKTTQMISMRQSSTQKI